MRKPEDGETVTCPAFSSSHIPVGVWDSKGEIWERGNFVRRVKQTFGIMPAHTHGIYPPVNCEYSGLAVLMRSITI